MTELNQPDSAMYWFKSAEKAARPDDHANLGYIKYKIGVLEEYSSKWDGNKKISGDGDNAVYGDTSRSTALFTVKVPKDYDGVMVAILKSGSNEKSYGKYKERYRQIP